MQFDRSNPQVSIEGAPPVPSDGWRRRPSILPVVGAPAVAQDPRADLVRAAQLRQQALLDGAKRQESAANARRSEQEQLFAARFNELVNAVAAFSKRYNEGHGVVWPKREAERLAKAMHQLQQAEKLLREAPEEAPRLPWPIALASAMRSSLPR
jgi:hypothetical protein